MGSSQKGGGARTPYEAPNTLNSAQNLRIIDAISEGEISGFAHGNDAPFKSIYFDDTPVQNPDNSFNFKGVTGFFQVGTPDQSYIPNFDVSERTVSVSASVKKNTPIIRAITDNTINRLRVTVGVERNAQVKDNGDTVPVNTELVIELVNNSGVQASRSVLFSEKGSGAFYHDVVFDSLPAVPFNIRVRRPTADSTSDKIANNTFFASYVEMIDAKLSYPNTALSALKIDSDQFGNNVPRRNYLLRGKLLQVPSNYDPETRQYSGGLWDGSFKTAWTNNPAWVFYDLLTNERYSTLARRLTAGDIDKWALYQIAKYCDELVPDGFGGQEPRFVCNAYITDQRQAGELLNDLASAFCGLSVWNGNQISVMQDKHTDPVAVYSNANVVDGEFSYAGASLKSIHTAVHVRYADKHDGYRSKVEYIADDEAVARYGLNIKSVTAFGCDSRGQAVRFGTWILQTELRQQNTVSFSVGREGLKHLPYDVIRIADNDYAGAQLGGRVVAVSGDVITLDRDVSQAVGALLYYVDVISGSLKNIKIIAQPKNNQVRVETAISIKAGDTWGLTGKVKSRLYRAVSIKENTDDGTYTITALLHDPAKYGVVDESAIFDDAVNTLHSATPELNNATVSTKDGGVVLSWDNLTADGSVLDYDIKIYRNNQLYRHIPDAKTPEIALTNLPNGDYRAEIRGRNARGVYSAPLIKAWSINYTITALRAVPKTLAIELNWVLPEILAVPARTEIWYSTGNMVANAQKLVTLPTPQNSYTLTGVSVIDRFYFWARLVDENGNSGEYTNAVLGQADPNPAPIVAQIQGAITKSALSQALIAQLQSDDLAAENRAKADAAAKIAAEANARAAAIRAETTARTAAIATTADTAAQNLRTEVGKLNTAIATAANQAQANLTAKADELVANATALGNRITNAENVNAQQATAIQTVTAAQNATAAALEVEKKARADGDKAEAAQRATLAAKVSQNTAAIAAETQARTTAQAAEAKAREALAARLTVSDTRNDNQPPTWYWANYPKQTVREFKMAQVLGLGSGYGMLQTDVQWANASGGKIEQKFTDTKGLVWRRFSDTAHTYTNGVYNYSKDTWGAWAADETVAGAQAKADAVREIAEATQRALTVTQAELTNERNARVAADNAQTSEINSAKSRLGAAESSISTLQQGLATQQQALAQSTQTMTAKIDNLQVGGRNLLLGSAVGRTTLGTSRYVITPNFDLSTINELVLSVDVDVDNFLSNGGALPRIGAEIQVFYDDAGTDYKWFGAWLTATTTAQTLKKRIVSKLVIPAGKRIAKLTYNKVQINNATFDRAEVKNIKLEIGTIATAWTPAPEDLETSAAATQAELTAFKEAQATVDTAQTREINAAKSQIGAANSAIEQIRSTKAEKAEVGALARTTLQSEWRSDVQAAENRAKAAAATDAQSKADAAKAAAIAAADTAAQTKANAAKAAAVAESANTAQSKADAAKAAAIADAAAKDAVIKQQAATDAQAKADAAKTAAIAEANRLNTAINAKITELEQTVSNQNSATATKIDGLTAKFDNMAVGGRNLLRNSNRAYSSPAYSTRYELTQAPSVGEDVTITLWGELGSDRTGIGVYNSHGFNEIANLQQIAPNVWRGVGKWKKPTQSGEELTPNDTHLNVYFYPRAGATSNIINQIKLERGNIGTDWTPAPEDLETSAAATQAELTAFKEAQATANTAQTREINAAKSQIGAANSAIEQIRSTKAEKAEVGALARTTLQSEWRSDVQIRADSAKAAAITEANRLNTATNAKITALEQTVSNQNSATATKIDSLTTKFSNMSIGGRNLILNSGRELRVRDASNTESHSVRFDISQDIDFASIDELMLSSFIRYDNITRAGSRWWRIGIEAKITLTDNSVVYPSAWITANVTTAQNGRYAYPWKVPAGKRIKSINHAAISIQNLSSTAEMLVANPKIEIGNVATDWSPAPEDADTKINNLSANIQTTQTAVTQLGGKVQSLYSVKVQAVGNRKAVAGLALGADGQTGDSQMLVMADKFALVQPNTTTIKAPFVVKTLNGKAQMALSGDFVADGTILGKHIAASQTINAPNINGGSLNIGNGRFVVDGGGHVKIQHHNGKNVGLKLESHRLVIYDEQGRVQVCLGELL